MGIDFGGISSSIGDFSTRIGLSGGLESLANALTTLPGLIILCLLGLVVICVVVGVSTYLAWREVSLQLETISEAMDQQSRLLEKMRRTLADVMEVVVLLEAAPRQRARFEPSAITNASATALLEELELLKAEIASDLPVGPAE